MKLLIFVILIFFFGFISASNQENKKKEIKKDDKKDEKKTKNPKSSKSAKAPSDDKANEEIMTVANIAMNSIDKHLIPANIDLEDFKKTAEHLQQVYEKVLKDVDNQANASDKVKKSFSPAVNEAIDKIGELISVIAKDANSKSIISDPKNQKAFKEIIQMIKNKFAEASNPKNSIKSR